LKYESIILRHGKTVKLDVALSDQCEIVNVVVSGDFFAYPEDAIEKLEDKLRYCNSRECIENAFEALREAVVLRVDVKDLENKLVELVEKCRSGQHPARY
jgi:hypothetical protein